MKRADITPGGPRRARHGADGAPRPGQTLLFVVDEVGQFVARDVQKMLDLQARGAEPRAHRPRQDVARRHLPGEAHRAGRRARRPRVELARLMDRFPLQVHLEPSDISEVTSKRVLSKNAEAEKATARAASPSTAAGSPTTPASRPTSSCRSSPPKGFVDLYPLLPYQIDLIIQVVSGLRTQGGASKHVGGANRTIIKLAQQLLIHPDVDLAERAQSGPWRGSIRSTTWSPATSAARSAARSTTSATRSTTRWPSRSPRRSACCSTSRASTARRRTSPPRCTRASMPTRGSPR